MCAPGTFSSNGVEPCNPCLKGKYQSDKGQTRCLDCPDLESTASQGSTSVKSCMGEFLIIYIQYTNCLTSLDFIAKFLHFRYK